jgi:hypothetical protein
VQREAEGRGVVIDAAQVLDNISSLPLYKE